MSVAAFEGISKAPHTPRRERSPALPQSSLPMPGARHRHRAPPRTHPDAARALVLSVIKRIEGYLDEETAALRQVARFRFQGLERSKEPGSRRSQPGAAAAAEIRRQCRSQDTACRRSAKSLPSICRMIRLHLDAVKEIASILSDAIQNAESDGTYTRSIGPYRSAP